MRAIVFDLSIPKYLAARALGDFAPALYDGPPSCLSLREIPGPQLPGSDWLKVKPLLSGICGSDLAFVYFKGSPALSPFGPSPFVPGHEVLGVVTEVGAAVTHIREGDRVAIDPWLRCDLRGCPPCARCAVDEYATCERAGTGPHRGMMIGASADFPGGFSEAMVAHESQCFPLAASISDERGVLMEPLSVAVHGVLRNLPPVGTRTLVIGGGPIAFSVVWAARELAEASDLTLITLDPKQATQAERLGADRAWAPEKEPFEDRAARLTGAAVLTPDLGPRFLAGGFDTIFDCVGTEKSFAQALRFASAGGTIVMVGAAGVVPKIDLTHLWTKELRVVGTLAYGYEQWRGERRRTFAITRELLETSRRPIESLVTHRFALDEYRKALRANLDRAKSGALKTVLVPGGDA